MVSSGPLEKGMEMVEMVMCLLYRPNVNGRGWWLVVVSKRCESWDVVFFCVFVCRGVCVIFLSVSHDLEAISGRGL